MVVGGFRSFLLLVTTIVLTVNKLQGPIPYSRSGAKVHLKGPPSSKTHCGHLFLF